MSPETVQLIKFCIALAVLSGLFFGLGCIGDYQRKRDRK